MAPITEYRMEQLQLAANVLKGMLRPENDADAKLVQKGFMLFRQGLVSGLRFDGDTVVATVQDVTAVSVRIDLNFLETSVCSCPSESFCRHQVAVFFQALSHAGSVSDWVEEWRKPLKTKKLAADLGLKTARDLLKASKKHSEEANYEEWLDDFSRSFYSIMRSHGDPQPYVISDLFRVFWRKIKADAPVKVEWRNLYELVAAVSSFRMLAELSEELGHSDYYLDRYYRVVFQGLVEDGEELMGKLSVSSLPFSFDQFIEKLRDDAGKLLEVYEPVAYEGINFYRMLWSQLLKKSTWVEAERIRLAVQLVRDEAERVRLRSLADDDEAGLNEAARLRRIAEEMSETRRIDSLYDGENLSGTGQILPKHAPVVVGLVELHILGRRDEEALALLERCGSWVVPFLFFSIEMLIAQKEWKRLGGFVDFFISRLHVYLDRLGSYHECTEFTLLAMDVLGGYCEATGRLDLFERTMVQTLPYSYREYDSFLFEQGSFDKWIELQAFVGMELEYLAKDDLNTVKKQAPAALLPFYTQAVQGYIDMKNRGSYREAVRLLKKLRTIYKKLKRVDDWERYFERLLVKTKRLRAFHEECVRGKLINVE